MMHGTINIKFGKYIEVYYKQLIIKRHAFLIPKIEFHQTMRETGCLPSVALQSEREVIRTINTRENILEMVQRSPHLSTRRLPPRIGVSHMQVWQTLHEEDL